MELAQTVLTCIFVIMFYGFFGLFIVDFLLGISVFMQQEQDCSGQKPASPEKKVAQTDRLSFNDVCIEFAKQGMMLERHRSGHYCYRVAFGCDTAPRFKKLQDALDWLTASTANKPQPCVQASLPLEELTLQ